MIYLIATKDRRFCKIGRSINPEARLASLQSSNFADLELLEVRDEPDELEQVLHFMLASRFVRGEWFHMSDDVLDTFRTAQTTDGEIFQAAPPLFSPSQRQELFGDIENPITQAKAMVAHALKEGHKAASLSVRAGLHRNALYGAQEDDWNPKAETLEKLWPILTA